MLSMPSSHSMPSTTNHLHHPPTIHPSSSPSTSSSSFPIGGPLMVDSFSSSSCGSTSPSLSLRTATAEDSLSTLAVGIENGMLINGDGATAQQINLQIFVPELQMQKCFSVPLDELVWDIKRRLLESLPQQLPQYFNFGLFLPPCDGRAGKFLLEDRPIRDYPFHDCVPYVELKYKKRVYKMLRLDEKALRSVHSKSNLRKLADAIQQKNAQKVERLCTQGMDPNFHDVHGETPLTLASGIPDNREVLVQLVGGGAHLDFRNTEGQTGMHKAAFLSVADNVRTLLELSASPNYRDLIGLTPLYYNMLSTDSNPEVAEMLLAEAADLQVVDMHGNTALHQACKNGLAKHVEQLIFYGADMNARNVNGNSPLHVCAVNGRVDCAQVLLYRGANPGLMNRQNQTAIHVAQIVGNLPVVDVICCHTPQNIVPFRETPKLNPRRRLSNRQISIGHQQDGHLRRRSLSHCSSSSSTIASQSQQNRFSSANVPQHYQGKISPSPSMASSMADYGTLRRIPAESVQHEQPGFESNIARILVIPRGPKGFGFILRGARHVDSMQLDFHPTPSIPALQFFEGVDMQGMAMKAGLRPGDFLLEINGVDVRSASHEQVVQLIHQSGDTITLKVITVDLEQQKQQQIYAAAGLGANYATIGRRNHSVPRGNNPPLNGVGAIPPPPPQRNPSTTLSFGRGSALQQFCTADLPPPPVQHNIPPQPTNSHQIRCASVKLSRNSAVRRISAAELEHLMVKQGSSQQSILLGPEQQQNGGGPKKFTSLAEMKRRKQPPIRANSISDDKNGLYGQSMLKNSTSSPDLLNDSMENGSNRQSHRHLLRPKTPPPPPPPIGQRQTIINGGGGDDQQTIYASTTTQQNASIVQSSCSAANPPPPPPPPPNLLIRPNQASTPLNVGRTPPLKGPMENDCRGVSEEALRSVRLKPVPMSTKNAAPIQQQNTTKCTKMEKSAPIKFAPPTNFDSDLRLALAKRRSKVRGVEEGSESGNDEIGTQNQQQGEKKEEERKVVNILVEGNNGTTTNVGRYNAGLSLRESVLENVSKSAAKNEGSSHKMTPNNSSHSPPGGFIGTKKDSGYTSSRTSLEPSECGDCVENNNNNGQQHIHASPQCSLPVKHRVNQMDPCPPSASSPLPGLAPKPAHSKCHQHQRIIPAANNHPHPHALSSSSLSPSPLVRIPPIDYDQSEGSQTSTDSGNQTDFEQQPTFSQAIGEEEEKAQESGWKNESNRDEGRATSQFHQKPISEWESRDVNEWLEELGLREYCAAFVNIHGNELLHFDRTRYTALGVTRVGDRQRMEQSLKEFIRE